MRKSGNIAGVHRQIISGTSMAPELRPGDVVDLRATAEDLHLGDLVAFVSPGTATVVVHRLVAWRIYGGKKYCICKGDRRLRSDCRDLSPDDILGVVFRMDRNGRPKMLEGFPWRMAARCKAYLSRLNLLPALIAAGFRKNFSPPILRVSTTFRLEKWFLHRLRFYHYRRAGDRHLLYARFCGTPFGEIVFDDRSRCVEKTGIYRFFSMMVSTAGMVQEAEKRFPGFFD